MEKILMIGTNTRPLINSALELDYELYSVSYFRTADCKKADHERYLLKQIEGHSCGKFEENYSSEKLYDLASDWIDEVDYIIPYTGISSNVFPSKKILGNKNTKEIENKYSLYKKLKKLNLQLPETFKIKDVDEAVEIANNHEDNEYILKPLEGSGGLLIEKLNNLSENQLKLYENQELILQEYISGENISSSVLSSKKESELLTTSKQIIGCECPGLKSGYIYCGNILPYIANSEIKKTSEEIADKLNLLGSNGIDMILNDEGIYIIEVNPRLQGTYECIELSYGINMLDTHIKATKGEISIPNFKGYSIKKIIYSEARVKVNSKKIENNKNIHDLPYDNVIIEKGQPIYTVITSDKNLKIAKQKSEEEIKMANSTLNYSK